MDTGVGIKNKFILLVVLVVSGLVACSALLGSPLAYASSSQTDSGAQWVPAKAPSEPSDFANGGLGHVSCSSADSCQAIGTYSDINDVQHSLIQHYDGTSWSRLSSPDPVDAQNILINDLTCSAASFCQAVGSYEDSGYVSHSVIYSYNGSSWSIAPILEPIGAQANALSAVDCVSSTFCMAVGSYNDGGDAHVFTERYNGSSWNVMAAPDPVGASFSGLSAVDCVSSTFCQATGSYLTSDSTAYSQIQSYNGSSWTVSTPAQPITTATSPNSTAIVCLSTTFCQALGFYSDADYNWHTAIQSYDGSSWSTSITTQEGGVLRAIDCGTTTSCQAVGSYYDGNGVYHPLAYAYNGANWAIASTPEPSDFVNSGSLHDVSCTSASFCQAVGTYFASDNTSHALVFSYNGASWSALADLDTTASSNTSLEDVDCVSNVACQAVGEYNDSNNNNHPLIAGYAVLGTEDPSPASAGSGSSASPSHSVTSWNFLTAASSGYKTGANFDVALQGNATTPSTWGNTVTEPNLKLNQDENGNMATAKSGHTWWPVLVVGTMIIIVLGMSAYRRTKKVRV